MLNGLGKAQYCSVSRSSRLIPFRRERKRNDVHARLVPRLVHTPERDPGVDIRKEPPALSAQ